MKWHVQSTESSPWHAIHIRWLLLLLLLCNVGKAMPQKEVRFRKERTDTTGPKCLEGCCEDSALSCLLLSQASCRETDTTAEVDLGPASRAGPLAGGGWHGISGSMNSTMIPPAPWRRQVDKKGTGYCLASVMGQRKCSWCW